MNQIINVNKDIYIPSFNEELDEYIDISPYKPYERNCIQYECRCRAGSTITGNTGFKLTGGNMFGDYVEIPEELKYLSQ